MKEWIEDYFSPSGGSAGVGIKQQDIGTTTPRPDSTSSSQALKERTPQKKYVSANSHSLPNPRSFSGGRLKIVLLFLIFTFQLQGQNMEDLVKQRNKLKKEIEFTSKQLKETEKDTKEKSAQYANIQRQIGKRKALLNTITAEIADVEDQISDIDSKIDSLTEVRKSIQKEYGGFVNELYLQELTSHPLLYIMSADNLNSAWQRWQYLRQLERFRSRQQSEIFNYTEQLETLRFSMDSVVIIKSGLLDEESDQVTKLNTDKKKQEKLIASLKKKESQLKKDLKSKKKANSRLQSSIADIIRKEEESRSGGSGASFALTPEAKKLHNDFKNNHGRLPWPVKKGFIASYFGKQPHPQLKNISIENNGIDIRTETASSVLSVFNGEVAGVASVPGYEKLVIVKHGNYYSVYSRLNDVFVAKGDKIKTGEKIGVAAVNPDTESTEVHLEIWLKKEKQNPLNWLLQR